jgi:uncharacterized DUF497 family protein
VKYFDWEDVKNAELRTERGIGFEDIVFHIERGDLLDILEHPNRERYGGQRIVVVRRQGYVYLVPFVEDEHTVCLKTIIPSRKATFRKDRRLNIPLSSKDLEAIQKRALAEGFAYQTLIASLLRKYVTIKDKTVAGCRLLGIVTARDPENASGAAGSQSAGRRGADRTPGLRRLR